MGLYRSREFDSRRIVNTNLINQVIERKASGYEDLALWDEGYRFAPPFV